MQRRFYMMFKQYVNLPQSSFYHTQSTLPTNQYLCNKCWMTGKSGINLMNQQSGPNDWHCCYHLLENDPKIQLWYWLPLKVYYQHQPNHSFQLQLQHVPRVGNHLGLWFQSLDWNNFKTKLIIRNIFIHFK